VERGEPVLLGHCGRADVLDQLVAESDGSLGVEVDVEAPKVAGASGGFTLETGSESEVVYKGDRPLASAWKSANSHISRTAGPSG
jgi:hypothetical protein